MPALNKKTRPWISCIIVSSDHKINLTNRETATCPAYPTSTFLSKVISIMKILNAILSSQTVQKKRIVQYALSPWGTVPKLTNWKQKLWFVIFQEALITPSMATVKPGWLVPRHVECFCSFSNWVFCSSNLTDVKLNNNKTSPTLMVC